MIVEEIPHHLRNTITHVDCPIYLGLDGDVCRPPKGLAIGDTLMLLGLLRNHGRAVKLHLDPGPLRPLVQAHPMVSELALPSNQLPDEVRRVAVRRFGRDLSWYSDQVQRINFPVQPLDRIRVNPILGHSICYKLESHNDRPGGFVLPDQPPALAALLAKNKPTVVLYPINPGRKEPFWADLNWWRGLMQILAKDFALVLVGAPDYGDLASMADAVLPSDDPASRLEDITALIAKAHGFVGVDGGISHLATAVNDRMVIVWDAMTSFRHWASAHSHHIVMSNPHGFRYPQSRRLDLDDMKRHFRSLEIPDGKGNTKRVELPEEGFRQAAKKVFGSLNQYAMTVQALREVNEERGCVQGWMASPQLKDHFYRQSLGLARAALLDQAPPGANWIAQVSP